MSRVRGLDHVQLAMPRNGEDDARHFYGDLLGLREVPKPEPLRQRGGCWFAGPGVHLHISVESDFRPASKAHPALLVDGLDVLRAHLAEAGVDIDDDALGGVRRFYARDPFGNRIEFVELADAGFTER